MISYKKKILLSLVSAIIICFLSIIIVSAVRNFLIEGPKYSENSGFFEDAFQLKIFSFPGVHIYYTLDGSEPTIYSDEYTQPITIKDASNNPNVYSAITGMSGSFGDYIPDYPIDKATVVKSIAVIGNYQSEVSTAVYFVGFQDKPGYENVKIMSMVVNPYDLFSEEGIYVVGTLAGMPENGVDYSPGQYPANYNIESKEMRRKAHIILWDTNGSKLAEEDLAIGIHGGWSKSFRQKGFNFYQADEYGMDNYGFDQYMLRTSGYRDTFQTMFRDVLNQELVNDRDIATQASSPCILFINGEYWGIYNLQQRYSETYFKSEFGIDEDNIICIKSGSVAQGESSDIEYYNALIQFAVNNDLSKEKNYEEISRMMDIQSFIDYNCFECYIANMDWPINNNCCFRSRKVKSGSAYEDGRWRWAPFDTDDSVNIDISYPIMGWVDSNPFTYEAHWAGNPAETELMLALRRNEEFCTQFKNTFIEMAEKNFDYNTVKVLLDQYAQTYRIPMTMTQNRFQTMDYTEDTFNQYVSYIDDFFRNRAEYVIPYMEAINWKVD